MPAPGLRIDHLAFPSFDAGETHRFYVDVLGFRPSFVYEDVSREWGGRAYLMTGYHLGDLHVHFFQISGMRRPSADGLPPDIRHVAFGVSSRARLAVWKRRLTAKGVRYSTEDHDGVESVYFTDPNGVTFEITNEPRAGGGGRAAEVPEEVLGRWSGRGPKPRRPPRGQGGRARGDRRGR